MNFRNVARELLILNDYVRHELLGASVRLSETPTTKLAAMAFAGASVVGVGGCSAKNIRWVEIPVYTQDAATGKEVPTGQKEGKVLKGQGWLNPHVVKIGTVEESGSKLDERQTTAGSSDKRTEKTVVMEKQTKPRYVPDCKADPKTGECVGGWKQQGTKTVNVLQVVEKEVPSSEAAVTYERHEESWSRTEGVVTSGSTVEQISPVVGSVVEGVTGIGASAVRRPDNMNIRATGGIAQQSQGQIQTQKQQQEQEQKQKAEAEALAKAQAEAEARAKYEDKGDKHGHDDHGKPHRNKGNTWGHKGDKGHNHGD